MAGWQMVGPIAPLLICRRLGAVGVAVPQALLVDLAFIVHYLVAGHGDERVQVTAPLLTLTVGVEVPPQLLVSYTFNVN